MQQASSSRKQCYFSLCLLSWTDSALWSLEMKIVVKSESTGMHTQSLCTSTFPLKIYVWPPIAITKLRIQDCWLFHRANFFHGVSSYQWHHSWLSLSVSFLTSVTCPVCLGLPCLCLFSHYPDQFSLCPGKCPWLDNKSWHSIFSFPSKSCWFFLCVIWSFISLFKFSHLMNCTVCDYWSWVNNTNEATALKSSVSSCYLIDKVQIQAFKASHIQALRLFF